MAEYSMVSVPKDGNNPGMPNGKKNILIIFDFDQVKTYIRDEKGVTITAFALKDGKTPIGLFVDENSIDSGDEVDGDSYARGFLHHVNADHPGTELTVVEFKANNVNSNLGAIVVSCDPAVTTCKVYGTPCAPLKMQAGNEQDTNEAHNNHFELKAQQRSYPVGIMAKSLIPATDNADINTYLGISAPEPEDGDGV